MNAPASRLSLALERDFTLGSLRVSPSTCRVFAGRDEHRIEAQTMAVLVVLARAEGATVSREELIDACWKPALSVTTPWREASRKYASWRAA